MTKGKGQSAPPFSTWEAARDRAVFLAFCSGRVHRVKAEPPTPEWPWHRWRVIQTDAYVVARQTLKARFAARVGSHVPAIPL